MENPSPSIETNNPKLNAKEATEKKRDNELLDTLRSDKLSTEVSHIPERGIVGSGGVDNGNEGSGGTDEGVLHEGVPTQNTTQKKDRGGVEGSGGDN